MPASRPTHTRPPPELARTALVAAAAAAVGSAATIALLGSRSVPAPPPTTPPAVAAAPAPSEPPPPAVDAPAEADGASRDAAAAERAQLAQSVLALSRRGDALERRVAELAATLEAAADTGADFATTASDEGVLPSGEPTAGIVAGEAPFDEDDGAAVDGFAAEGVDDELGALVAAGLDSQSAAALDARRDEFELARLELIDRATREGWRGSERFGEAIEALENTRPDLREALGDAGYDRYLYAQGESNRVSIGSIIGGSAAELAGLEIGDVVLSYADARVFGTRELQRATRGGERGEYVQLVVLRDGESVAVDVPRGPLGVTLRPARRPPL